MNRLAGILVVLFALAACGGDGATTTTAPTTAPTTNAVTATTETTAPPTTAPTTTVPTSTSQPTTTTAAPATTTAAPDPGRVELTYTGGELAGGLQQVLVDAGTGVTLVVETDVSDEVHVHGYDLFFDVSPGVTEFSFVADIPGIFEVELEGLREPIVKLEVR